MDLYAEYDSTPTTQVTEEDNITGRALDGRINYVAGVYYYSQNTSFTQDTGPDWDGDPVGYLYAANNLYKSYAAYAQVSFKITPPLELTVGRALYLRSQEGQQRPVLPAELFGGMRRHPDAGPDRSQRFRGALPGRRGGVRRAYTRRQFAALERFQPARPAVVPVHADIFAYGSITTGYNAGGFNQQLGTDLGGGLISYNPEKLTDYEIGIKTEWLDKRLRFNVTGFYQKYSDIQTTILVTYNHVPRGAVQTGASEHEDGIEAELEFEPTHDLLLRANMSYLNQAYDSIDPSILAEDPPPFTLNSPVSTAPKYTYAFDATYTYHLESGGTVTPSLNWRAVGAKAGCNPIGACYLPAYGLLGSRIDFKISPDSPWTMSLWGTNLLDTKVVLSESLSSQLEFGLTSITLGRRANMAWRSIGSSRADDFACEV